MARESRLAASHAARIRHALRLARRAYGLTSPNPMVGAVLVKSGRVMGEGWHRKAGQPHAEVEAMRDAAARGNSLAGATLFVTLEPCSTGGRTPPCTEAIIAGGIREVVFGAIDPNPRHSGRARDILKHAGIRVTEGVLGSQCSSLNEAFNHWITSGTPLVTVKAAMTLDGKIATTSGESKWITGPKARGYGMKMRQGADAIIVGVNTVLADNPRLTVRSPAGGGAKTPRRIVLDSKARTPLDSHLVVDEHRSLTTIIVTKAAPASRVAALKRSVRVIAAPAPSGKIDLQWLLKLLGSEDVTCVLVEGGGEVNAAFLTSGLAQRVAFFYAPMVMGGRGAIKGVAGRGVDNLAQAPRLEELRWRRLGVDWLLTARVVHGTAVG